MKFCKVITNTWKPSYEVYRDQVSPNCGNQVHENVSNVLWFLSVRIQDLIKDEILEKRRVRQFKCKTSVSKTEVARSSPRADHQKEMIMKRVTPYDSRKAGEDLFYAWAGRRLGYKIRDRIEDRVWTPVHDRIGKVAHDILTPHLSDMVMTGEFDDS